MQLFRTIIAVETAGGAMSAARCKREGRTLRLSGQVIDAVNPDQLHIEGDEKPDVQIRYENPTGDLALLQTVTVGNATGGNRHRSGARSHERLLPGQAEDIHAEQDVDRWKDTGGIDPAMTVDYTNGVHWGIYEPAVRRWEQVTGRPAPHPTRPDGRNGRHRLSPLFTEWMQGYPKGHTTDPNLGLTRNQQIKTHGNGVCTRQAVHAGRQLLTRLGGCANGCTTT